MQVFFISFYGCERGNREEEGKEKGGVEWVDVYICILSKCLPLFSNRNGGHVYDPALTTSGREEF